MMPPACSKVAPGVVVVAAFTYAQRAMRRREGAAPRRGAASPHRQNMSTARFIVAAMFAMHVAVSPRQDERAA